MEGGGIQRDLSKLDDMDRLAAMDSVQRCAGVAHNALSEKVGRQNMKVGSIMSHMIQWKFALHFSGTTFIILLTPDK